MQALRLLDALRTDGDVDVTYLEVDPRFPAPIDKLQRLPIVRTLVTSIAYLITLVVHVWKYDTIHIFSAAYWSFLLAPTPAIIIGRLFGKRILLNYHSGEADDHLTRWGWHVRPLLRLADDIIVPTQFLVDVFAKHRIRASAIPNQVAVSLEAPERKDAVVPRFFSNRNFEPHYNVAAVLDAFAQVQGWLPSAELVLTGGGSLRSALESRARALGFSGYRFTGPVQPEAMKTLYANADIFVNASLVDNMPLSILEAYSTGLPVVTSDAGGIPWIAKDGETALVVRAGDVNALAAAMHDAVVNWHASLQRAARARAFVTEFYAWPAVRSKWLEAYAPEKLPSSADSSPHEP